jgi:hypothetical protein
VDGCDVAQESQPPATTRAGVWLGLGKFRLRFGIGSKMKAYGLQGAACSGAHEADVTHACKAFGKDVDQPTADEFMRC